MQALGDIVVGLDGIRMLVSIGTGLLRPGGPTKLAFRCDCAHIKRQHSFADAHSELNCCEESRRLGVTLTCGTAGSADGWWSSCILVIVFPVDYDAKDTSGNLPALRLEVCCVGVLAYPCGLLI